MTLQVSSILILLCGLNLWTQAIWLARQARDCCLPTPFPCSKSWWANSLCVYINWTKILPIWLVWHTSLSQIPLSVPPKFWDLKYSSLCLDFEKVLFLLSYFKMFAFFQSSTHALITFTSPSFNLNSPQVHIRFWFCVLLVCCISLSWSLFCYPSISRCVVFHWTVVNVTGTTLLVKTASSFPSS